MLFDFLQLPCHTVSRIQTNLANYAPNVWKATEEYILNFMLVKRHKQTIRQRPLLKEGVEGEVNPCIRVWTPGQPTVRNLTLLNKISRNISERSPVALSPLLSPSWLQHRTEHHSHCDSQSCQLFPISSLCLSEELIKGDTGLKYIFHLHPQSPQS